MARNINQQLITDIVKYINDTDVEKKRLVNEIEFLQLMLFEAKRPDQCDLCHRIISKDVVPEHEEKAGRYCYVVTHWDIGSTHSCKVGYCGACIDRVSYRALFEKYNSHTNTFETDPDQQFFDFNGAPYRNYCNTCASRVRRADEVVKQKSTWKPGGKNYSKKYY